MLEDLKRQLANPGSEFRGKPFWAWNSKMDPEELRRQVRLLRRMGLGGFFMHSRTGLDTEYLGKDWFDCVRACVDEAKKLGMEAWAYDEDRWPSGAAGGLVTKNPKYQMKRARLEVYGKAADCPRDTGKTLLLLVGKIDGHKLTAWRVIGDGDPLPEKLAKGESIIHFTEETSWKGDWHNGFTYLDTMDKGAVAEFIKVTHEAYKREIGREFSKTIPGIFFDEPNHGNYFSERPGNGEIPWTPSITREFKKRYGYDILPHLAEVFFDVEGAGVQTRYHYHDCVTALFVEAFSRQIGEWCGKNRMLCTGHMLCEDTLMSQSDFVGSCMRHYEHMQAPGMDLLTERWRVFMTAKQVSSAARQFGRKLRLSETYGCTGWDFSFAGHKALGDWQLALGINLRCQHLAWYSMRGEAKRDYPACIFYQSPWWEDYGFVEDYFARAGQVMSRGEEVRDILVLHPVESMWLHASADNWQKRPEVCGLHEKFVRLSDRLLADHLDYDYGDEEIMSRHAQVVKSAGGVKLRVGKASYRVVVVPEMQTMRASTLTLLQKFRDAGGKVVYAGAPAEMVDALPSDVPAAFAAGCARAELPGLARELAEFRTLSVADENGREIEPALYLLRGDDEAFYLFICNTGVNYTENANVFDMPRVVDRRLAFPEVTVRGYGELAACAGDPVECDLLTGELRAAKFRRDKNGWTVATALPECGSRLFIFPKEKGALAAAPARAELNPRKAQPLGREFDLTLAEPNVLALDWPEYSLDGGETACAEILTVDKEVRKALGMSPRGGGMKQPWVRGEVKNPKSVTVALDYRFMAADMPSGGLTLCMENPDHAQIFVNDREIPADMECGWWCDVSLRQLPVPEDALVLGENHIRIVYNYDENDSGLEIIYLRGNFGVRDVDKVPTLCALPETLQLGDWTAQGLPFYSGNVSYRQEVKLSLGKKEKALLLLGEWRGTAVRVRVNGADAGLIAWAPYAKDITAFVKNNAENVIELEVLGHRRNSHGPLHMDETWPHWTGPEQFWQNSKRAYNLVPCGLLGEPQVIIADSF